MGACQSVSRKGHTLSHSLRKTGLEQMAFKYIFPQEEDPGYSSQTQSSHGYLNHKDDSMFGAVSLGFQETEVKDTVSHATLRTHEAWSLQGAWMVSRKILQRTFLFKSIF